MNILSTGYGRNAVASVKLKLTMDPEDHRRPDGQHETICAGREIGDEDVTRPWVIKILGDLPRLELLKCVAGETIAVAGPVNFSVRLDEDGAPTMTLLMLASHVQRERKSTKLFNRTCQSATPASIILDAHGNAIAATKN